jgi:hypothetical protein
MGLVAFHAHPSAGGMPAQRLALAGLALLALLRPVPAAAAREVSREFPLKAAFLYKAVPFVTWPEAALTDEKIRICVLGRDPFGEILDTLNAEFNRRPGAPKRGFEVHRFEDVRSASNAEKISVCHVLYVSSLPEEAQGLLASMRTQSVFTVSDGEHFLEWGGIVHLFIKENNLSFQINLDAAEDAGLRISSNLLRLAEEVYPRKPGH